MLENDQTSWDLSWKRREDELPLPGADQGYRSVLILGTTGAGKTTLVRQILGTHPRSERFPSTSTAKSTTCDMELILTAESQFHAVVSFLPFGVVRSRVTECLSAAISAALEKLPDDEIARRILHHEDQRFRLEYVLGRWVGAGTDDDDVSDDDAGDAVGQDEQLTLQLQALVVWIRRLAASYGDALDRAGLRGASVDKDEIEGWLQAQETFHKLVNSVVGECHQRVRALTRGRLVAGEGGWPQAWSFRCEDRAAFLETMRIFTSNHHQHFGRLLTPLVEGIRVAGPFRPAWHDGSTPNLVLLDGEGLGHDPRSATTLPTRITRRFPLVDAIILVDNATQPMQASSMAALRRIAASGHERKLLVTFTRMDQVRADNLPDARARRNHVRSSLENVLSEIGRSGHPALERALGAALKDRVFFLGFLDSHPIPAHARGSRRELERCLALLDPPAGPSRDPDGGRPRFDRKGIDSAVRDGVEGFRDLWAGRLGLGISQRATKEHDSRIRALTRRLGELGEDEYKHLQPAAELLGALQERLGTVIEHPASWDPAPPGQPAERTAHIRRRVFAALHDLVQQRLVLDVREQWLAALRDISGTGAARRRAAAIVTILHRAFPIGEEARAEDLRDQVWDLLQIATEPELDLQLLRGQSSMREQGLDQ